VEELAEGLLLADRYLLGPLVGHGAMGQVHLAEDTRLARPVAIKSLRPELARYPDVRQRFGQEARAAARISHPNVVRVYDSGEHGRIPYLVMECLPGSTLVDELAWGSLEPRRARQVGLDLLGALDAAHRLGIVHRDVKPGNILLGLDLDASVKVSDFGIAKSADDHSLTDSGSLVGTAAYLAPERVAGESAGPAADLYSAGVVLYEAVAGRRPYEGDTTLATALAIHMGGAPSLLELLPDVDPQFAAVVERAIARDQSDRWRSAAEMAEALRAWRPTRRQISAVDGPPSLPAVAAIAAPTVAMAGLQATSATEPPATEAEPSVVADPAGPSRGHGGPRARRARLTAVGAGAAAVIVLVVALAAVATGGGEEPAEPASPPTSAELVAAPASVPAPSTADADVTVAPVRPVTTAAARPRVRPAAPATTSAPAVRATTTTRAAVTTTRPPPTTTPAPSAPSTTPTTAAPAVSTVSPAD
jgi:hypothetical protein